MGRTLDRTKDYGIICGGTGEAKFYQFGVYFDAAGDEIGGEEGEFTPAAMTPAEKRKATMAAKAAAQSEAPIDPELEAQINANLEG